ncbi:thiol reductant ABC exporter subunit CydD [Pseudonocardia sp. WMMC193]|uniref:thiol reductant ABC exporter subunit CydD n=1 Tax=Pseudonocardia sp. WMMC193 TaxID=2911965 RepID=UPI001F009C10|nr:thiol reductant ABC exporter subunit CydD [Pseudonocardia sp. WMMC193]MCF7549140.1 thiol reductant ABC exporter subunit CydD [Pseudonocardia sp. WMMC193]
MRPLDPRLLRTASAVRTHLLVAIGCGAALTGLILLQAWLVSRVIADATAGAGLEELALVIAAVAAVAVARAGLAYGSEAAALRSAAKAKSQLRMQLVEHTTRGRPRNAGELVTLATRGLDALDDYFARYLPQLVLAVLLPVAVLVVVAGADWISAVVIAVTVPLIPLFMALVGMHTQARTARQWSLLERLGGHFLDVVEGLPTLALFRRAKAEAALVRRVTDQHREATMGTLKVAFLSAFVLEVLATLAVALVAVEIGFRLLWGDLPLSTALFVLILAPEAYLPLREVGARFHASMEGVAAAEKVFAVLDSRDGGPDGTAPAPRGDIELDDVWVVYPERTALSGLSAVFPAGRTTVISGPSGAGKSTILNLLLRFTEPTAGRVTVGGVDLADVDTAAWRRTLAWVPQDPHLFDESLADNIRLGAPDATLDEVRRAAHRAELDEVVADLPEGLDTRLGERGTRLSSGQRRRVALARAFLRDAPVVLLDEPTAHLDPDNAAAVRRAVESLTEGRTAVIVTHDPAWTTPERRTALSLTPAERTGRSPEMAR